MKKIFTLIAMAMMAYTVQAAITVYVKAEAAPYLWAWTSKGNIFSAWPGEQFTQKTTVQGTEGPEEFWFYTFADDVTNVNVIFNDGGVGPTHANVKQTGNITGITSDRYFTYDGASTAVDVTEQHGGVVPDAEVNTLTLSGNSNGWGNTDFAVVEAGKTFRLSIDLTGVAIEENFWIFKIRPNGQDWVGYGTSVTLDDPGNIIEDDQSSDHNFGIDLDVNGCIFTLTATWGGGKKADENWTLKVEKGNTTGITTIKTDEVKSNAPIYNLGGQRVNGITRGVVIQNGKKIVK